MLTNCIGGKDYFNFLEICQSFHILVLPNDGVGKFANFLHGTLVNIELLGQGGEEVVVAEVGVWKFNFYKIRVPCAC